MFADNSWVMYFIESWYTFVTKRSSLLNVSAEHADKKKKSPFVRSSSLMPDRFYESLAILQAWRVISAVYGQMSGFKKIQ